jgi:hypothetical protein
MGKILFSLTFATALLAFASSEASAFVYSSFVCQAVGVPLNGVVASLSAMPR